MSAPLAVGASATPSRRFWSILAVFAGVAPLATVAVILSLMLGIGMTVPDRVPELFPYQWAFCLPVALISGALFGWAAVRGRSRLWIALAPALLMPPVLAFTLDMRSLNTDTGYVVAVLALFGLPLLLAWALSRRWH